MAGTEKIMASLNTGLGSSLFTAVFFLLIFLPSCSRYTLTKGSGWVRGGGEGQCHTHLAQPCPVPVAHGLPTPQTSTTAIMSHSPCHCSFLSFLVDR